MCRALFCIVLHCSAFGECSTKKNNRQAIVLHCSTFAKCSTEQNNANPIVLLGMQLFYICQMQYRAEQWRTMQTRLFYSVRFGSLFAKRRTMRCNGIQCPPPVNDLPGSVIIIQSTHTGATPPHPLQFTPQTM